MIEEPTQPPVGPSSRRPEPVHPLDRPQPPAPPSPPPPPRWRVEIPQHTPVLCYVILGFNVLVFLTDFLTKGLLSSWGAKDNQAILAGQYWRLITPIFLHGGILHLGLNSYFLYVIGPQVERPFGPLRFAAIYLLSGAAGAVASFALTPDRSIGASGALFGLVGALIPFLYRNRSIIADTRRHIAEIAQVIVFNLLIGLSPRIDNWGHIGGLIGGMVLAWFSTPLYVAHPPLGDLLRIEDRSSSAVAWGAFSLGTFALLGITGLLIFLKG